MAIPFKSMRYRVRRRIRCGASRCGASVRRKNEWAYLTPVPQNLAGPQALNRISSGRHAGRPRPAAGRQEHRAEAVRDLAADDRSPARRRRVATTSAATSAATSKYGMTAEPHRRLHRQHRLRAGGGRRAAGEPHALQPVLSRRSATSSSRGAASSTSRAAAPARHGGRRPPTRRTCSTAAASA